LEPLQDIHQLAEVFLCQAGQVTVHCLVFLSLKALNPPLAFPGLVVVEVCQAVQHLVDLLQHHNTTTRGHNTTTVQPSTTQRNNSTTASTIRGHNTTHPAIP